MSGKKSQRRATRRDPVRPGDGVVALLGGADRLRRHLTLVVARHGLTLQQYNVLRILRGAEPEGLPTMEVRRRMIERAPGITRLVDHLEREGWVERRAQPGDRRCVLCRITPAGLRRLHELDKPIEAADAGAFAALDRGQLAELIRLLERVAATPARG